MTIEYGGRILTVFDNVVIADRNGDGHSHQLSDDFGVGLIGERCFGGAWIHFGFIDRDGDKLELVRPLGVVDGQVEIVATAFDAGL